MATKVSKKTIIDSSQEVLDINYADGFTMPSRTLYPHQWLWDSCFHAIGLRHTKPQRALQEIQLLLRGQWPNGMIPHMIFSNHDHQKVYGYKIWKSHVCDDCVIGLRTSAITQPPIVAEAFELVVKKLPKKEQKAAVEKYLPQIIRYHEWIYRERDPDKTGRVVIIHPWESGMDNNPALISNLKLSFPISWWERQFLGNKIIKSFYHAKRKDIRLTSAEERTHSEVNWMLGRLIARYRAKLYNIESILFDKHSFVVESIMFNMALLRSNKALVRLAKSINVKLTKELLVSIERSEVAFDDFWHEQDSTFYDRDWQTGQHITIPTISSLLPIAAKKLKPTQLQSIKKKISSESFSTRWPVPTQPVDSHWFSPIRYWQGPVWINMNWFLIDGLKHNGAKKQAGELKEKTIDLIVKSGIWEYYSPIDGSGHGINNFSWTAALAIDLAKTK